jgi:hypothetical protein
VNSTDVEIVDYWAAGLPSHEATVQVLLDIYQDHLYQRNHENLKTLLSKLAKDKGKDKHVKIEKRKFGKGPAGYGEKKSRSNSTQVKAEICNFFSRQGFCSLSAITQGRPATLFILLLESSRLNQLRRLVSQLVRSSICCNINVLGSSFS